jgi:hypothetical protein
MPVVEVQARFVVDERELGQLAEVVRQVVAEAFRAGLADALRSVAEAGEAGGGVVLGGQYPSGPAAG